MDDDAPSQTSEGEFNKIDLSQLQGFSFGTQWTQDKRGASDRREREGGPPRQGGAEEGGPERRDRRGFRRADSGVSGGGPRPSEGGGPPERRDGPALRQRYDGRPPRQGQHGMPGPERMIPYESREFSVSFFPEDASFGALVKMIRASCRTIELFEIARTVLDKPDRFTVVVARRERPEASEKAPVAAAPEGAPAPADPAVEAAPAESGGAPPPDHSRAPSVPPLAICVPDGLPFETEEAAIAHATSRHLGLFFDISEVEIEPPKGNYLVVNRCTLTGELLAPPNYHRYNQIVQQHHAAKGIRMPLEAYRARIETVRDPEVVNQWLEKMKKATRYVWKAPAEEGKEAPSFDTLEEAKSHLIATARDKLVRSAAHARFHGRAIESLPGGEIRRAVEGALERQRRFPLDTANGLRGRLRREHFTIFKKGAKGISYVCAVKRKFRVPGQVFAENIGTLLAFIETHPMMKAGQLVREFVGFGGAAPSPVSAGEKGDAASAITSLLTMEQREKFARVQGDLLWLVREGYVTEFIDGSLYASPPVAEARKKEAEQAEVDPENFPETPAQPEATHLEGAPGRLPEAQGQPEAPAPAPEADPPAEAPEPGSGPAQG